MTEALITQRNKAVLAPCCKSALAETARALSLEMAHDQAKRCGRIMMP